jgi:hypothetical protein
MLLPYYPLSSKIAITPVPPAFPEVLFPPLFPASPIPLTPNKTDLFISVWVAPGALPLEADP